MSQITPHSIDLDGRKYTMFMLPPLESHDLLLDVLKMVGPGLGPLIDAAFSSDKGLNPDAQLTGDFFAKASTALFSSLDKGIVRKIIDNFSKVTMVEGEGTLDKTLPVHFSGRLPSLYRWLAWGMRVQWGGLVGALSGFIPSQGAKSTE